MVDPLEARPPRRESLAQRPWDYLVPSLNKKHLPLPSPPHLLERGLSSRKVKQRSASTLTLSLWLPGEAGALRVRLP